MKNRILASSMATFLCAVFGIAYVACVATADDDALNGIGVPGESKKVDHDCYYEFPSIPNPSSSGAYREPKDDTTYCKDTDGNEGHCDGKGACLITCATNANITCFCGQTQKCPDGRGVCDGSQCVECTAEDLSNCTASAQPYCYQGACAYCDNKSKDGDETGIDCGNERCGPCLGNSCMDSTGCMGSTCVDGVCCNNACAQPCQSCKLPGSVGTCTSLPDAEPEKCDVGWAFNVDGYCFNQSNTVRCLLPAGALFRAEDCINQLSNLCMSGTCDIKFSLGRCLKGVVNKPCTTPSDCNSKNCDTATHRCK